jgi:putative ABC transport system permease protein
MMLAAALYRAAIRLAPHEFRREYAAVMTRDFQDVYHEEKAHGSVPAARYAVWAIVDALRASFEERRAMIARDVTFALRTLAKTPLFAFVVVLTLALGIGANAAVFSVIDGVLLRPLPYAHTDRLVMIWKNEPSSPTRQDVMSKEDTMDAGRMAPAIEGAGYFTGTLGTVVKRGTPPFRFAGAAMSPGLFDVLGVRPQLGRTFGSHDADIGAPRVALISERFWRDHFGADPRALGQSILVNDRPTTVIGVLPPNYLMPDPYHFGHGARDVFLCLRQPPNQRGSHFLHAVARVRPGASLATVQAQLDVVASRLAAKYPATNAQVSFNAHPLADDLLGNARPALTIVSIAVLALLLVACANVANLLLARAATREREIAVRVAVGAPRARIVALLLTEVFVLAGAGAVVGTALAALGVRAFVALDPGDIPRLDGIRIDGTVLTVTALTTVLAALIAGLTPAVALTRPDLVRALKQGDRSGTGGGGRFARNVFVVVEVALALALVVTSALLVRSFDTLTKTDVGFRTEHLAVFTNAGLTRKRYPTQLSKEPFYDRVLAQLRAVPGVDAAALGATIPFANDNDFGYNFRLEGAPAPRPGHELESPLNAVTPDYFRTLGVGVVRGRVFSAADRYAAVPVAIVDEGFARRYFGNADPVGKRLTVTSEGATLKRTIVGIVPTIDSYSIVHRDMSMLYIPLAQSRDLDSTDGVVRTSVDPASLAPQIAAAIRAAEPSLPAPQMRTYATVISEQTARERTSATLLGLLAAIALVLALAGIYSLVSYNVTQRTREFGIRIALGARPSDVARDVVVRALRLTALGILAGVVVAGLGARALRGQLYGVDPFDPVTFAAVTLLLIVCATFASLAPALRATRVDPIIALRYD